MEMGYAQGRFVIISLYIIESWYEITHELYEGTNHITIILRCAPGETGEFVAKIVNHHPVRDFPGYLDETATKRKIIHNVFTKGDSCYKSGDLLVADKYGWIYFVDRMGDTYRWKGENISTTEVEAAFNSFGDIMLQVRMHYQS